MLSTFRYLQKEYVFLQCPQIERKWRESEAELAQVKEEQKNLVNSAKRNLAELDGCVY